MELEGWIIHRNGHRERTLKRLARKPDTRVDVLTMALRSAVALDDERGTAVQVTEEIAQWFFTHT